MPLSSLSEPDGVPACKSLAYCFAAEHSDRPQCLQFDLPQRAADSPPPALSLEAPGDGGELTVKPASRPGAFIAQLRVPPAPQPAEDDELIFLVRDDSPGGLPPFRVVLRRTNCRISTALIQRQGTDAPLRPQSRAAMLWYAFRRYRELVGLKRFSTGKSGSDVLVFQPRLRDPDPRELKGGSDSLVKSVLPGVISQAWGSPLLVKTGETEKVREEWDRFRLFAADRLHPFMARSEAYLETRPAGEQAAACAQATLIGSFLGGDLLQAESLEQLVRGTTDVPRCLAVLEKLFSVLAAWYAGSKVSTLRDWRHMFEFPAGGRLKLFGKVDLADPPDRERYRAALAWDVAFAKKEHLRDHLLGKGDSPSGLLYRLLDFEVRYSLIHGDLHPRNALADAENVWLLDFGNLDVAPTLFDFCKLEVYLRLWCLELNAADVVSVDAAMELEHRLLDHMTGSEATLEPVRGLAPALGADAGQLLKVSHAISFIRRRAARYGLGSPDRRDYLAVLFLAVLHALRYAGESPRLAANCRLLVGLAWVLEDVLSCTVGLEPFARDRAPLEPLALLSRRWLAAPGAPGRIAYFLQGPDGRRALEPVAAMRGVAQNDKHHLDVFDHTMLVLAYLETLLEDPVGGLMDPAALDRRTQEHLRRQGIALPDAPRQVPEGKASVDGLEGSLDAIRARFGSLLGSTPDADARLVLKWAALFHDVGKPSARTLNVHPKTGRATVQFLGHEVYGLQIAAEHLHAVFARPCPADGRAMELREGTWVCPRCAESAAAGPGDLLARARRLVLKHHDHHMLVNRYTEHPKFLDSLRAGVRQGRLSQKEASHLADFIDPGKNPYAGDFPLLILHGFADLLSLRGASSESNPLWVAELDLLLLTAFVGWEAIRP